MSERVPKREREIDTPRGVIIKIDPRTCEDILFRQMAYQLGEDTSIQEIPKEVDEIKEIPMRASMLMHFLTKNYLSTLLGGQIISPFMGKMIVLDRISQFGEILLSVCKRRISDLEKRIYEKKMRGEDFEKEIREILEDFELTFIVIRELINRLLTALHINSPPPIRPPLVNIKLGYDKQE